MAYWASDLRGVYIIWYRDLLRLWRDRTRAAGSLAAPLLFLFAVGGGLAPVVNLAGDSRLGYLQFMFPGIVALTVLFSAIFSAMSIVWDREFGFLKEILVAPVSRTSVAVGKALGGSTVAVVQGLIMLVFAPLAGIALTPLSVLAMIPFMFLTAFTMTCLGIFLAARMRSMEGFQMIINFVAMPMFFLSGAMFPLGSLPPVLSVVTRLNPVSYGVDPMRRAVMLGFPGGEQLAAQLGLSILGHPLSVFEEAAVLVACSAVLIALAVRSFSRTE